MTVYNFDQLANRTHDYSKKWDRTFVTSRYGEIPKDYISMWIADLDYELAPPIYNRFNEILSQRNLGYIYSYQLFYEAVIQYLKLKTTREIMPDEIMLDYSIVSSLYHVVQAFVPKNGKVLINTPVYNPYREASERNGVYIIENELELNLEDYRYHLNFKQLEEQIKTEKPSMYILCSPHNPGGTVWSKEDLERISQLCIEHDVVLVVDEAHSDHVKVPFTSILSLDELYLQKVIYLNSPNKPFNIAGLKTSYVVITNPVLRNCYQEVLEKNHIDEPNVFGLAGLIAAYTDEGMEWLKQSYDYILANYNWAKKFIDAQIPELTLMPLDSTYVMWINVSRTGMNGDDFTQKLATETGVLVQEGSSFGESGRDFIRLNLGTSREYVEQAFKRIEQFLHM